MFISDMQAEKESKYSTYNAPQWILIWRRFKKSRIALAGGIAIVLFYLIVLFAEFIGPYDPAFRDRRSPLAPPMRIHLFDAKEGFSWPFLYGLTQKRDLETFERYYVEDKTKRYPIRFFVRGDSYKVWNLWEGNLHLFGVDGGRRIYILGTDMQGRDLFSRTLFGTRLSLTIGLVGVCLSLVLGIMLGAISGYLGGTMDLIIQRIIEVLTSIPALPLWMGLSAAVPSNWSVVQVFFAISIILSVLSWPRIAREVRGKFLILREEDFVIAARLDGVGHGGIMFRHMLPSFLSHIIASATLAIPQMILGETALSFLGLGLQPPAISWGVLLQAGQNIRAVISTPWLFFPGLFVIIAVMAFNFFGDGLRDAADPYKA